MLRSLSHNPGVHVVIIVNFSVSFTNSIRMFIYILLAMHSNNKSKWYHLENTGTTNPTKPKGLLKTTE